MEPNSVGRVDGEAHLILPRPLVKPLGKLKSFLAILFLLRPIINLVEELLVILRWPLE